MSDLKLVYASFLLLAIAGWILRNRMGLAARRAVSIGLAGIFLLSWLPVAWFTAGTLEWRYAGIPLPPADADVIVVLSAGVWPENERQPFPLALHGTVVRCRYAAYLYHNWKAVPVIVSGGRFTRPEAQGTLADVMRELLIGWQVPPGAIQSEVESKNTFEQAVQVTRLLKEAGFGKPVLVTEALHMPRAAAAFRKQNVEVLPSPCGFRSLPDPIEPHHFLPSHGAISLNEDSLREWLALGWYRVRGRI